MLAVRALRVQCARSCLAARRALSCAQAARASRSNENEPTGPQEEEEEAEPRRYAYTPVGFVESAFVTRNGTPRQGVLTPSSRAFIRLDRRALGSGNTGHALEGLSGFSHCWLLFHFHANRPARLLMKVHPPRLGGEKARGSPERQEHSPFIIGVFASRSPYRPNPIGLACAKIEGVDDDGIRVSGVALLDGTPVLDVKPFVPFSDNRVGPEPGTAPLAVSFAPEALEGLRSWPGAAAAAAAGLEAQWPLRFVRDAAEAETVIREVLLSEVRSTYRREQCVGEPYQFLLEHLEVHCVFDDAARAARVTRVEWLEKGQGWS